MKTPSTRVERDPSGAPPPRPVRRAGRLRPAEPGEGPEPEEAPRDGTELAGLEVPGEPWPAAGDDGPFPEPDEA